MPFTVATLKLGVRGFVEHRSTNSRTWLVFFFVCVKNPVTSRILGVNCPANSLRSFQFGARAFSSTGRRAGSIPQITCANDVANHQLAKKPEDIWQELIIGG